MINFFMVMIPPTVTYQEHKVSVRNGKPIFYNPPELKAAKLKLLGGLAGNVPDEPLEGALRLMVKWMFPAPDNKKIIDGQYKDTKPDTDNLNKMLKDCMTELKFWKDDAQVASEIIEKFWVNESPPGIYVAVQKL